LNDSKKLSPAARDRLYERITRESVAWGVGVVGPDEIDGINILNATIKSMERALCAFATTPDYLLIDAVNLKNVKIAKKSVVKGDSLSLSIAAASIVAKVTRDRLMHIYDGIYPGYGFSSHKGYGTKSHVESIKKLGLCPIHRKTFCHYED